MSHDLIKTYPVFKTAFDECCDYLTTVLEHDLRDIIFNRALDAARQINQINSLNPHYSWLSTVWQNSSLHGVLTQIS